jgi:hypothetical protein
MLEDPIGDPTGGPIDGSEPQLVRLALPDRPGSLALVASRLAAHGVDILRVDVVQDGEGTVVDDLLVAGGDLATALVELEGDVEILGLREHAELPDPGLAMADALAGVSGAASLGAARHALLAASIELVAADSGVLLRDAGHGWLRPVAATAESLPPVRDDQRCLARDALARSRPEIAAPYESWAPAAYAVALGMGRVLVVPAGNPAFFALAVVRHDAFPFVEAEVERVQALLRIGVGILAALGERVVRAPFDAPEYVSGAGR